MLKIVAETYRQYSLFNRLSEANKLSVISEKLQEHSLKIKGDHIYIM